MGKTIYLQADDLTLYLAEQVYQFDRDLGLIDGLPKDDLVVGFPISLEVIFGGKTIVKNLTCLTAEPPSPTKVTYASFADASERPLVTTEVQFLITPSGEINLDYYLDYLSIAKDLAESVFGQPSSEVADDETTYYYEHVKVVISSVEEDPFAKFAKNYSDKDAPEVKAPMFDELKKYLIAKLEMSEETAKTAFANCYSVVDLLNAACDAAEQGDIL